MLSLLLTATIMTSESRFPADSIQVMSFNIRFGTADDGEDRWELRRPKTLSALKARRPDIIGLQEALDFQIDEICEALSGYRSVGVGRDDGRSKGEYSAIVYDGKRFLAKRADTFWLSETPSIPNSKHWGNGITRICSWAYFEELKTGRHFYVFNMHLDHVSQPSREKGIALILRRIRERGTDDPVLITGDLNVGESNPVIQQIRDGGFTDTFRALHPDEKSVGTFTGFGEPGVDKIDYVFADSGWTIEKSEIVRDKVDGRWISDHFPVVAWLRLR